MAGLRFTLSGKLANETERSGTGHTGAIILRQRFGPYFRMEGYYEDSKFNPRGNVYDDYAHDPTEVAATLAAVRNGGRVLVLFQPHLYSRTRHLATEIAHALAAADVVAVADVYPAREQPLEGVTGKLIVDALAERRPGMPLAWTPQCEDGAHFLAQRARAGDRILTIGAGNVDGAAPLLLELLG